MVACQATAVVPVAGSVAAAVTRGARVTRGSGPDAGPTTGPVTPVTSTMSRPSASSPSTRTSTAPEVLPAGAVATTTPPDRTRSR